MDRQIQGTDNSEEQTERIPLTEGQNFHFLFIKNKQKEATVVIVATMIEGNNNMNNSSEDNKDENIRKIANIFQ